MKDVKFNPAQWALRKIFVLQISHPVLALTAALILAALAILYTVQNLGFETSQKDLISPQERLIQLSQATSRFEELDSFVVVIQGPDVRRSLEFLNALVPHLTADKNHYQEVFYRIDPHKFRRWALLYLNEKDLSSLTENLQEHRLFLEEVSKSPTLENFFEQINREMASRMVGELFTGFLEQPQPGKSKQPFDLTFLIEILKEMDGFLQGSRRFVSPWEALLAKGAALNESEEGYFWTKGKRYLLIFITPSRKADFAGTWHALTALRDTIAQVKLSFPDVEAGVTGPEALNADQMGTALSDMSLATLISLGGLALLLIIFWRGIRRPLIEMLQLLVALSLTFGFTTLVIGHLNILSVTFAPMLLGLGIDYGVHWFARYQEEERRNPGSVQDILQATMERLGPGVLLAGMTAALSFFPLVLTGFKGLVELGIICSMGLAITTGTTLGLLPALILLFDQPRRRPTLLTAPPLEPFFGHPPRRVFAVLLLGGLGFFASIWGATRVRFDLNMLHLQSPKVESVVWENKLLAGSELSSIYGEILAPSLEQVRQKTRALEALPEVSRVESVDTLIPQDQRRKLDLLRKLKPLLSDIELPHPASDSIHPEELEKILGRIRFKMVEDRGNQWGINKPLEEQMTQVRSLIDAVRTRISSQSQRRVEKDLGAFQWDLIHDLRDKLEMLRANVNSRPMTWEDLPPALRERFVSRDHLFLIRIFPKGDVWDPQVLGRFVHALQSVDPDVVGDPVTLYIFTKAFRDGCIKAAIYAVIFIFIFLLFTLRDLRSTLLALVPLLVGTVWTLGLMDAFEVSLNLANSLFLPLVVGAAVEYGIIIIHRWRQREKGIIPLPLSTGLGVLLAGLTTTVGFCSLTISSHRGIFSLGLLTTIGSLAILAAALLFLPALLESWEAARRKGSS